METEDLVPQGAEAPVAVDAPAGTIKVCGDCGMEYPETAMTHCPKDGSLLVFVSDELGLTGRVIGDKYEVRELLGEGGMGVVYRAYQRNNQRDVAIKFLRRVLVRDSTAVKRFLKEVRVASRLKHANTITIFDFDQTEDHLLYFTMELLEGRSLADVIYADGLLAPARALGVLVQACNSLAEAHEQGLIHRDLKPENILLVHQHGNPDFVKVLDFGIAKANSDKGTKLTQSGTLCGTAHYMCPEGAQAQLLDARADVYSLGVILYEMLSGRLPFDGDTALAVLMKHVHESVPPLPPEAAPPGVAALVARMLAKDPDLRPSTVVQVRDEVQELLRVLARAEAARATEDHELIQPPPPAPDIEPEVAPPAPRGRSHWALGALGLAAVVLAVALWLPPTEPVSGWSPPAPAAAPVAAVPSAAPVAVEAAALPRRSGSTEVGRQPRFGPEVAVVAGWVMLESSPPGADVYRGDTRLGQTPLSVPRKADGADALTLRRRGFRDHPVALASDAPARVTVTLERKRQGRRLKPF